MLSPKKVKHRKQMTSVRHIKINACRGAELHLGTFGLKSLEPAWLTARQLEAGRVAINRKVKRYGKLWLRAFPDKPITVKPAETRMGSGKGSPEYWVAEIQPGNIVYELSGVSFELAKESLELAAAKMPFKSKIIVRKETIL
jgi:large subunit ribosomal protein L16